MPKSIPGAHVVKAFNTVLAQDLGQGAALADGSKVTVFYAGDDEYGQSECQDTGRKHGPFTADLVVEKTHATWNRWRV